MDWTICGRGLSLLTTTPADCLDGPVSAINGAILHPLPCDYWVCIDEPKSPYDRGEPWGDRPRPRLVTKATNAPKWLAAFPVLADPKPQTYGDRKHMHAALPWRTTSDWCHWTVMLALYHAWQHGARRVRFLGVDMAGNGYAHSQATIGRKSGAEDRWKTERRHVAGAMTELAVHGGVEFVDLPFERRTYVCQRPKKEHAPVHLAYVQGPIVCAACDKEMRPVDAARPVA